MLLIPSYHLYLLKTLRTPATVNTRPSKQISYPLRTPLLSRISLIIGRILFIFCPNCNTINCPKIFRKSLTLYCQKVTCKTIWEIRLEAKGLTIYIVGCTFQLKESVHKLSWYIAIRYKYVGRGQQIGELSTKF